MIIATKRDSYKLYEEGRFGNKLRTWNSLSELLSSDFVGKVVMRYKGVAGGAKYPFLGVHLSIDAAVETHRAWRKLGARETEIVFNEAAPDEKLLLQGELTLSTEHYSLFWSDEKTTMRSALSRGVQWHGLRALHLLKSRMFPSSWEDLQVLLDDFPDSVVEFSTYSVPVGGLPGRNTVIWEVRNY